MLTWPTLSWSAIGVALGGLGLLLLGMGLMTEGLKLAAGRALQHLLGTWTRSAGRGLIAGTLITAVVQSSSAVTVATLGFVNAGLLGLRQAAWVIFGSNLGTTMTAWLVAMIGLRLNVEVLALPILGAGVLLQVARPSVRVRGLGRALAGFGALFLGIAYLKSTFAGLADHADFSGLDGMGWWGLLAGAGIGTAITVVIQSSSAAIALVLTASAQGVVSPTVAAALVVGANLGTTSTALLSAIGATPSARRLAALHVFFNLITAAVAIALLDPILRGIGFAREQLALPAAPATDLALFHTTFNLIGVFLMWPLAGMLIAVLERCFRTREEDEARARYLDDNVLAVPELAVGALRLELERAAAHALAIADMLVGAGSDHAAEDVSERVNAARRLLAAIGDYAGKLGRVAMPPGASAAVPELLRVHERLLTMVHLLDDVAGMREQRLVFEAGGARLSEDFLGAARAAFAASDIARADFELGRCLALHEALEAARERERAQILAEGLARHLPMEVTSSLLLEVGELRRCAHQARKVAGALRSARVALGATGGPAPAKPAAPEPQAQATGEDEPPAAEPAAGAEPDADLAEPPSAESAGPTGEGEGEAQTSAAMVRTGPGAE